MKWPVKKLGDLCVVRRGTTITQKDAIEGPVPVVGGGIKPTYFHNFANRSENTITVSGSGASAGFINFYKEPIFASDCSTVEPKNEAVNIGYIYRAMQNLQPYIYSKLKVGAAQPNVYAKDLANLEIPFPPLAEQRRIAALLDTADRTLKLRELAIVKLDQLAQSIFVEMFGDKNFPFKSLKQLGKVKTGGTPPSSKEGMFGSLIPFITPGDLENKSIPKRFLTLEGAKESVIVKEGSALVCCIGATIGKMSKARTESAFNQQLNAVEWGDEINPNFGIHAMRQIKSKIINGGSATTMPIIKKSLFEKLEIIVPPHELQEKFSHSIKKIETLIDVYDQQLAKSRLLMLSLQHQSFAVN